MARTIASRQTLKNYPQSLSFVGGTTIANNDLVVSSTFNLTSSDFSLFGVCKFDELNDTSQRMYLWSQTSARGIFGLAGSTNLRKFGVDNSGALIPFSNAAKQNTWYWYVLNFNSVTNNWNLYLNGVVDPTTVNVTPASSGNSHIFGHHYAFSFYGFKGKKSGVYLLKRQATAQEALDWWQNHQLPTTGTYEYKIAMTDGSGNPVDSGPNAYSTTKGSSVAWNNKDVPMFNRAIVTNRMGVRNYSGAIEVPTITGNATIPDNALIQNLFNGGGAFGYWVYPRSLGNSNSANYLYKHNGAGVGWFNRLAASVVPRLSVAFSTTAGEFRLYNQGFKLNKWNFIFCWYNSSSDANVPVAYVGIPESMQFVKPTVTITTVPVGTYNNDSGIDMYFGNNGVSNNRGMDGTMTGIQLYRGSEPSQAEVTNLCWYGLPIPSMTLIDTWKSGSGAVLNSDSGLLNASITAPAVLSTFTPTKLRTIIT